MPIQGYRPRSLEDAAERLVSTYDRIAARKEHAQVARELAISIAQQGAAFPPEVARAYVVLADAADRDVVEAQEAYEEARSAFEGMEKPEPA